MRSSSAGCSDQEAKPVDDTQLSLQLSTDLEQLPGRSWLTSREGFALKLQPGVLNLLPNSILDKLVHLLAQVCNKGLGSQGTSGLLTFLQLFLQEGEAIQQLVQDQGQWGAGALGQQHHVDAWPQGQAVHGVGH